jgi:hypothetical protein
MDMILTFSGPVLTLIGVMLGVWGTLLMCRAYHPFKTWQVIRHIIATMMLYGRGRGRAAREEMSDASNFAKLNEENRYRTLEGVYVLVFSFFVQMLGAALVIADLLVHHH